MEDIFFLIFINICVIFSNILENNLCKPVCWLDLIVSAVLYSVTGFSYLLLYLFLFFFVP